MADAESFVIAETMDRVAQAVVWRDDFYNDQRRVEEHAVVLTKRALHDEHIGNTVAGLGDASAAFRKDDDLILLFEICEVNGDELLEAAVTRCSPVSLHNHPIQVLAVPVRIG